MMQLLIMSLQHRKKAYLVVHPEVANCSSKTLFYHSCIKWFSDSQNACRIIQVGSMRKDLHVIAPKMFQFSFDNGIELEMQWIPRTKLDSADFSSRIIDVDDWQITVTSFFKFLDYTWGPHTVYCFANFCNKKVNKFYSRFWNPGCSCNTIVAAAFSLEYKCWLNVLNFCVL